jgi:hypothetical protein
LTNSIKYKIIHLDAGLTATGDLYTRCSETLIIMDETLRNLSWNHRRTVLFRLYLTPQQCCLMLVRFRWDRPTASSVNCCFASWPQQWTPGDWDSDQILDKIFRLRLRNKLEIMDKTLFANTGDVAGAAGSNDRFVAILFESSPPRRPLIQGGHISSMFRALGVGLVGLMIVLAIHALWLLRSYSDNEIWHVLGVAIWVTCILLFCERLLSTVIGQWMSLLVGSMVFSYAGLMIFK